MGGPQEHNQGRSDLFRGNDTNIMAQESRTVSVATEFGNDTNAWVHESGTGSTATWSRGTAQTS